ncbi:hypothetical protein HRR81_001117 [Exophiala dermatitidis]|nr:hypothetical protein HRR75_003611 [Exophiala dermatitidis]KAJ4519199.1 hypothetical protein HRR74_003940 [Exophiala dermatitidis]KAJ4529015.1 hypothetical protein HRR73_000035 [Exophiala dermatitidis]KAJ4538411.1 hypothetical protein HRR77_006896 [Exophiala dermatitidis]KAJ4582391.1 hypothetical protein HRR81_001117 [Exophiala dermatitidis]
MKAIHLIPALLSACSTIVHVHAQSAPDFPVQVKATQNLRVDFQSSNLDVDPAGALLQREDLLDPPTVQGPKGSTATLTFMLFMVDQDVSTTSTTTTTTTTNGGRQQLLHFFQPNLSGGSEVLFADQDADNFTSVPAASYIPPTPPAGDGSELVSGLFCNEKQCEGWLGYGWVRGGGWAGGAGGGELVSGAEWRWYWKSSEWR